MLRNQKLRPASDMCAIKLIIQYTRVVRKLLRHFLSFSLFRSKDKPLKFHESLNTCKDRVYWCEKFPGYSMISPTTDLFIYRRKQNIRYSFTFTFFNYLLGFLQYFTNFQTNLSFKKRNIWVVSIISEQPS